MMNVQCFYLYDEMVAELGTIETIPLVTKICQPKKMETCHWHSSHNPHSK